MKKPINIIIAEDQDLFREMIIPILKNAEIETIAQAANGLELLELLKTNKPNIVLLDIQMPVMDGGKALDVIKKLYPEIKVIMLTMFDDEHLRNHFVTIKGADGFLKKERIDVIISTIKNVYKNKPIKMELPWKKIFTARELQIIPLICADHTMKDVANKLDITEKTAEGHRQRLYKKTKCTSKAAFITYCVESGLKYLG